MINGQQGNPMPSAEFKWDPILTNYSTSLESGDFNGVSADSMNDPYVDGHFILSFDIKLNDMNTTGDEKLNVEIWAEGIWTRIATFNNADGSFDWMQNEIDITDLTFGKVFKMRFMAEGIWSADINSWLTV